MMRGAYKRSFQSIRRNLLFLALCWCSLSWTSVTRAQTTRIMVVSSPDAPSEVTDAAKSALSNLGTFVDPGAYIATARAQKLDPASESAIKKIGLKVNARLLVSVESEAHKCTVTFWDGSSGDVVGEQKIPVHGKHGKPAPHALKALNAVAKRAVNAVGGPNTGGGGSSSGSSASSSRPSPPVAASHPTPSPAQPSKRFTPPPQAAAEAPPEWAQHQGENGEAQAPEGEAKPEAPSDPGDDFMVRLSAAGGVGERVNDVPTHDGIRGLDTGFAPGLEIGLATEGVLGGHFVLSGSITYRTVLGAKVSSVLDDGTSVNASISSQSIMAGIAPGYRFEGPGSADLRLFLGFAYRTLSPSDGALPGSTILGPVLRPELRLPIAGGVLTLRIAPELLFALAPQAKLAHYVTGLSSFGIGVGGEANLDVRISKQFYIGVEFRESRVNVSTSWGPNFFELERFIALKLTLVI